MAPLDTFDHGLRRTRLRAQLACFALSAALGAHLLIGFEAAMEFAGFRCGVWGFLWRPTSVIALMVVAAAWVSSAVTFLLWLFDAYRLTHRWFRPACDLASAGRAVGWFFVPGLQLLMGAQMVSALAHATDPIGATTGPERVNDTFAGYREGAERVGLWRRRGVPVRSWLACWFASGIAWWIGIAISAQGPKLPFAIGNGLAVLAAWYAVVVVRGINQNIHDRGRPSPR